MLPLYEDINDTLKLYRKRSVHVPPHLHKSIEFVLICSGTLELGIGEELFHMETGDFAVVFPELIHHFQVFGPKESSAYHLLSAPSLAGSYLPVMRQFCPKDPVIPCRRLHPDIAYAFQSLARSVPGPQDVVVHQAFIRLILARCLEQFELIEKGQMGGHDIIYQVVAYIAEHFRETVTLTGMAHALGYSPYALSRVFSGTFHRNFNQYLNEVRLDYACALLQYTVQPITEVLMNSGFESQRTFNRVFRERYHMTPRQYRNFSAR